MDDKRGVRNRLQFAKVRLDDLLQLEAKYGDLGSTPEAERQQPLQEFLFHLVCAMDFLAQNVNDVRGLGLDPARVTLGRVAASLPAGDPAKAVLGTLHPKARALPKDPYSEEGSLLRIRLLRNRVCHHKRNPFVMYIGSEQGPDATRLFLDPRDRGEKEGSIKPATEELTHFWRLVSEKCEQVLSMS